MTHPVWERVQTLLRSHGIKAREVEHAHVKTAEDAAAMRGTPLAIGGKAILLRPGDNGFCLCVLSAATELDSKLVRKALGVRRLRFATPEELLRAHRSGARDRAAVRRAGAAVPSLRRPRHGRATGDRVHRRTDGSIARVARSATTCGWRTRASCRSRAPADRRAYLFENASSVRRSAASCPTTGAYPKSRFAAALEYQWECAS